VGQRQARANRVAGGRANLETGVRLYPAAGALSPRVPRTGPFECFVNLKKEADDATPFPPDCVVEPAPRARVISIGPPGQALPRPIFAMDQPEVDRRP
jgi:hypothetical protein